MNDASEPPRVDELLDQAFEAFSAGDRATAAVLAEQVLTLDEGNTEAEDLLAAPTDSGEIRRLTISFIDLVDSTALSTRIEPEIYRTVVGRYRDDVSTDRGHQGNIGCNPDRQGISRIIDRESDRYGPCFGINPISFG